TRAEVQAAFVRVRAATGVTSILVTHDLSEALRLADQVMVLRRGRVQQLGEPAAIVRAPATAYVRELVERARSAWPAELQ
ncbi:MAG TPA: hypothetical protein VK864_01580, partial [Longimicrobiales bacterium]|nr:hypothetical protein [Longimicrobiales bacterium]